MGNLTNYHSHSLYCDGRAGMEDFVRFALSEGFTSYGFSSHAPLPFGLFPITCVIKSPVISARKKMTSRKQGVRYPLAQFFTDDFVLHNI